MRGSRQHFYTTWHSSSLVVVGVQQTVQHGNFVVDLQRRAVIRFSVVEDLALRLTVVIILRLHGTNNFHNVHTFRKQKANLCPPFSLVQIENGAAVLKGLLQVEKTSDTLYKIVADYPPFSAEYTVAKPWKEKLLN
ncbi:hypothetical protein TNCV_3626161 [Trichonephila clavipes]|nr:hypothetical protein TNCV_3626161 [Trichonephila clavipes]